MDDILNDENNNKVDFLEIPNGAGDEAANFSMQRQRQESGFGGEAAKPTSKGFVRTEDSIGFLKSLDTSRSEYSLATARSERPFTHYTHGGNVLQILRFGLQSNNFKNRLSDYRTDPQVDEVVKQLSGFRFKQGASYQGKDSISLSMWGDNMYAGPRGVLLLIDPATEVWGLDGQRDATGYGHGIGVHEVEGGYEVGNATAYKSEVVACNVIPPVDIRAIVVGKSARILSDMRTMLSEQAKLYSQAKHRDVAKANEDMLANVRMLANLTNDAELQQRTNDLEPQLSTLPYTDVVREVATLQREGLQRFVGEKDLTEDTLRQAISERFNVQLLEQPVT
jgi:hypothetical protein